jgi:biopolymer transport protein ExbD
MSDAAKKTQEIAKQNESVKFEGKVVFQADQALNYALLKKVMYTAVLAGYSDFKLAVVTQ